MPVDDTLLNPPSGAEMAWDLASKGQRLLRSYIRLRMRLTLRGISLPLEVEQSVVRAYQEVEKADAMDADYGRKLDHLQWMVDDLENELGYSESAQAVPVNPEQQRHP